MAHEDFDPRHLTTDASINRLVITRAPGVPDRLAGEQAYAILSAMAVAATAADHGLAVSRRTIADDLGAALRADDPSQRSAALAVTAEVGLRLACLLSTLHDPGTATAQGWSAWRCAYLQHWATIEEVHLAGGLLVGRAGPAVVEQANATLAHLGVPIRVSLMPWPDWAALIGAARRFSPGMGDVIAVDFGGSRAKTGLLRTVRGGADEVTVLTTSPVPFDALEPASSIVLDDFILRVMDTAARDVQPMAANPRTLAVAVACYLEGGRRCAHRGPYTNLPDLGADGWRRRLRDVFGRPLDVAVVHDGTAAAAAVPRGGWGPGAVLVLGTALGVGFPPASQPQWRVPVVRMMPPGRRSRT